MENEDQAEEEVVVVRHRAPALLAVIRIISVLGMAFGISWGLFMLLGGWWQVGLISLAAAIPFFILMRFMEKYALQHDDQPPTHNPSSPSTSR